PSPPGSTPRRGQATIPRLTRACVPGRPCSKSTGSRKARIISPLITNDQSPVTTHQPPSSDILSRLLRSASDSLLEGSALSANPIMLVHGGAWAIPDDAVDAHLQGVVAAAAAGFDTMERGGSCLDAVEAAVVSMEDDETFDAGRGSFLNMDGRVQLDACMMDGATLRAGGVGCVEHIRHPIRAAKKILTDSPHVYFVANG